MTKSGYSLSIFISSNDTETQRRAVSDMIAARVEGIVYVPVNTCTEDEMTRQLIDRSGIPTVCMTTRTEGMNCVHCDLVGGMHALASHIIGMHPRSVVYLSGPGGVYTLDCRRDAFLSAFTDTDIRTRVQCLAEVDYHCAQEAARLLLSDLPDVIVCANDFMALGVVNLFAERGISVPSECMVAGYDDSIFSVASHVPLTTVRQDLHTMAEETASLIIRMIKDPDVRSDVLIPTSLTVRASTQRSK